MNASDLANSVQKELQARVDSAIDKEKNGTAALTDPSKVTQELNISNVTMTNLKTDIQMKLDTYINASAGANQKMRNITVYLPCHNTTLQQKAMQEIVITDFVSTITKSLMAATEVSKYTMQSTAVDTQKATDTVVSVTDTVGSVVNKALSTASILGSGWMIMVVVIVLAIPYFIYRLLNSDGGKQAMNTAAATATTLAGSKAAGGLQPPSVPVPGIPLTKIGP